MNFNDFYIGLISFSFGILFILFFKKISSKYNLLCSKKIPLIGGLSMILSFSIACLFSFIFFKCASLQIIGIILSSVIMLIFGLVDDYIELSIAAKLLAQIFATAVLIFFGVKTQIIYIGNLANITITLIWVLAITNAFNHLDIVDGVAGSVAWIISVSFLIISILNFDIKGTILSLALVGALSSFLLYNLPPAKIYMGNSGSHFLGFVLAAVAILISYAPLERKVALLSPIIILGFPIFDTAFLMLMRISKNKLPFVKSDDHLVLRFLALGYSRKKSLLVVTILCTFFCVCGIILSQSGNLLGILIIALVAIASILLGLKMSKVVVHE